MTEVPDHHGSHRWLVWPADESVRSARVDAIFVPTARPVAYLKEAAAAALKLRCPLVTLHSKKWTSAFEAASYLDPAVDLIAIDVPDTAQLRLPELNTSRLLAGTMFERRTDVSTKRNLALVLSHKLRWNRIVFLDDDIRVPDPLDLSKAAGLLDAHSAVGLGIGGFPKNSVVSHAFRAGGGKQETFIGGGAMAVAMKQNRSFFPNIYNDDWFFVLDAGKRLQQVATVGQVLQYPYDPYRVERARAEELGDVLAEGIFWLLDQGKPASEDDLRHWGAFLDHRKKFIEQVRSMVASQTGIKAAERKRMQEALAASLGRCELISPELCVAYLRAFASDQERWQRHVQQILRQPRQSLEEALRSLTVEGAAPLTWYTTTCPAVRAPVLKPTPTKRRQLARAAKQAEKADKIRALVAAGHYPQAEKRLTRLAAEDPQQAERLRLEFGFITLPDPDRRLIAKAWSAIAEGRSVQSLLVADDFSPADGVLETVGAAPLQVTEATDPRQPRPRRSPQQSGELLEQATVDLFARFFAVEPETILGRLRRQGAGVQFGHDIEADWTLAGSPAVRCHVECKNLDRRVTVNDIAGKLAEQKHHHRGIQVDHWILISPHHDGANELPGMLEAWDRAGEYPFSVQIWSPETRVREMFALEPAVYEAVYGRPPTQEEVSASGEVADLIRQRLAPRLRVDTIWRRYLESPGSFCFVNEDSRHFDELYSRHIQLRAADDRGALLGGTLMDQVIGWASTDAAAPMLLLADFGEGKSVFTYCLTRQLSEEFRAAPDGALFPLRIPLREFREAGSARGLLERRLAEIGATLADWRTLTNQVRTLVILDGFDEMSADLSPAMITANLRDIRSCLTEFSGSKVLITSRQRVLDGSRDWKRTLDRLGHPVIMRIASGPRPERVQYLQQFATDDASARKLASLRSLYDPIGLAAKPLFLEMIKETLRDLPDDMFSEMILYDTYIDKSLRTKWDLLADPGDELTSDELIENLREILEDVAVRLQETNGAYLYLRDYQGNDRRKIAELLWKMRDQPVPREPFPLPAQDDATNRVGIRSLLKAVPAPDTERWPVDFFHRSMREYFVARSIARSLITDERRARQILSAAPLLPEIAHFAATILRTHQDDAALVALEDLARSATTDLDDAYIGGNAFTLLYSAGGSLAERDWSGLCLDHARLRGADLHGTRFAGSSLRHANLDNADLQDADLTEADLEGVRLEETSQVLAVTALNGNQVIAAYEDHSLRKWRRQPGADWESQVIATLDHKTNHLQPTPMGRVLASGEGMLSVLDVAGDAAGSGDSAEVDESGDSSTVGEASIVRCTFRTSSRCRAAVLGGRTALFTEEGDSGQLLVTWLDMINARILGELHVDETVTAWTQLDDVLFALATPNTIYVVSPLGANGRKAVTLADPSVTCLSVRANGDHILLAAGHHDGSVSLTQLGPADTDVVAPQWTRHLHDGPVTDIFLDAEEQIITGSIDRRVCVTPMSAIRSDTLTQEAVGSAVQSLHHTLRCKGVRFAGVRTIRERNKLRSYAES